MMMVMVKMMDGDGIAGVRGNQPPCTWLVSLILVVYVPKRTTNTMSKEKARYLLSLVAYTN